MNRRELLKNAGKFLGLAALAPFVTNNEIRIDQESLEDEWIEFENEPKVQSLNPTIRWSPDDEWVTLHENAMQINRWNRKAGWDISEDAKDKTEWTRFVSQSFMDSIIE